MPRPSDSEPLPASVERRSGAASAACPTSGWAWLLSLAGCARDRTSSARLSGEVRARTMRTGRPSLVVGRRS